MERINAKEEITQNGTEFRLVLWILTSQSINGLRLERLGL